MEPNNEATQGFMSPEPPKTALESVILSEAENSLGKFSVYVDKRLSEGVSDGSSLFREKFATQPEAYRGEVIKSFQELSVELGLSEAFTDDPINLEMMLSISDSWAKNRLGGNDETERTFLLQTTRLLAGNESRFNSDAIQKEDDSAGKYINDLSTPEHAKEIADFERFSQHVDSARTERLQGMTSSFGEGSLLAVTRDRMGIVDSSSETPFRVMVLDTYRESPSHEGQKRWEEIFDSPNNSQAFVMLNPLDKTPTVIMSSEDFDVLFEGDEFSQRHLKSIVQHEYAHTQRKARFGHETQLGRIFDERMVTRASEGGMSHADTGVILRVLDRLLPEEEAMVIDMLDVSAKYPDRFPDFLKFISNRFGLRSTLLLSASQPKNYMEEYGISQIPEIRHDPEFRMTDLIGEVIGQRAAIDPEAIDRFKIMLMSLSEQDIEMEQFVLRYAGIKLPPILQSVIDERVAKQQAD